MCVTFKPDSQVGDAFVRAWRSSWRLTMRSSVVRRFSRNRRLFKGLVALSLLIGLTAPFASGAGIGAVSAVSAQTTCDYPTETIQIMAPAAPGGGWDTTAREVQT